MRKRKGPSAEVTVSKSSNSRIMAQRKKAEIGNKGQMKVWSNVLFTHINLLTTNAETFGFSQADATEKIMTFS